MGNKDNKNKGRKSSLGGHLKRKSLGKWFYALVRSRFFYQKSKFYRFDTFYDENSLAGHFEVILNV